MEIKIKKLHEHAVIPRYAKEGDAGLDLTATSRKTDPTGFIEYGTGLAVEIPAGYVGLVFPRSSISKVNMSLTNAVGVIDSGYRGEILFRFKPTTTGRGMYEIGERIGQIIIMPYPHITLIEVDELEDTARGDTGFGSSDLDAERTHINENGLVEKYTLRELQ
jgi:dUTP pyrophosphatase